jgi:hypothetical protein
MPRLWLDVLRWLKKSMWIVWTMFIFISWDVRAFPIAILLLAIIVWENRKNESTTSRGESL